MKYPDETSELWDTQVPASGQSDTVQGELLRAIEKLRDEARRNGNGNWDEHFEMLRLFLRKNLGSSDAHSLFAKHKIKKDIDRLADFEHPYTDVDLYDRLTDALIEWCHKHPDPIKHHPNAQLKR